MKIYAYIYLFGYALLIVTLFVLPFLSFEGYALVRNTIGELGAQKVSGNWLANTSIMVLSIAIALLATKQLRIYWKQLTALYFFCISFFYTGIYQLAGLDAHTYIFNYTNDALHVLFSIITGFAFCVFCVFFIFIVKEKKHKWQTAGAFLVALLAPLLMEYFPEYRGLWQRILFLGIFGWLFYALTSYPLKWRSSTASRMKRFEEIRKHIHTDEK